MNTKILWGIGIALIAIIAIASFAPQSGEIRQFSSTNQLESFLEQNTDENYNSLGGEGTLQAASADSKGGSSESSAPSPDGERYSTTNVQVGGVDEPDFVKNDGTYIYSARDSTIVIVRADGLDELSQTKVEGYITNMFLNGDQLIIFGTEAGSYGCIDCEIAVGAPVEGDGTTSNDAMPREETQKMIAPDYVYKQPRSFVQVYDITDRTAPKLYKELFYDGNYRDARMTNGYVYLITNQQLIKGNDGLIMPAIAYDGSERMIAASEISYFPGYDYGYQLTTIFALELDDLDKDPVRESFLTGYTQTLYMSTANLYLTAPKYVSYETYEQRILEEVVLPSLTGDARAQAEELMDSDRPLYEKNEVIQALLADNYNTLSESEKESFQRDINTRMNDFQEDWRNEMQKTVIHKIKMDADIIEYVGKAEVRGSPLNQFSMDEHNGYLRIATTTDNWFGGWGGIPMPAIAVAESGAAVRSDDFGGADAQLDEDLTEEPQGIPQEVPEQAMPVPDTPWVPEMVTERETSNNVFVLDENMNLVGALEGLAEGERIYSARFIQDRVYLVTFKQIDPLFVIDLSEPSNPRVLGELKIPGYSTYLHPFNENMLIGIGQDSSGDIDEGGFMAAIPAGVKIGLFDVSDPTNPREIDTYIVGDRGSYSDALYDHKSFMFDSETGLLVLPINIQERIESREETSIPEEQFWYPTVTTFQGAYVFKITAEGIENHGRITHLTASEQEEMSKARTSKEYYYPPYEAQITRSLFIGETLYTISQRNIQANSMTDLAFIDSMKLPLQMYYGWTDGSRDGGQSSPGFAGVDSDMQGIDPAPSN